MKQWGVVDLMPHWAAFWRRQHVITHPTTRHDTFPLSQCYKSCAVTQVPLKVPATQYCSQSVYLMSPPDMAFLSLPSPPINLLHYQIIVTM